MTKTPSFKLFTASHIGLARNFRVNPMSCNNPGHFEEYLNYIAIEDYINGMGTTHILLDAEQSAIIGYITFKSSALTKTYNGEILGFPALEISELAIAERYERQGFGSRLVMYAVVTAANLSRDWMGIQYITLRAEPKAVAFYERIEPKFKQIEAFSGVPAEQWNCSCTPMFLKLPEL